MGRRLLPSLHRDAAAEAVRRRPRRAVVVRHPADTAVAEHLLLAVAFGRLVQIGDALVGLVEVDGAERLHQRRERDRLGRRRVVQRQSVHALLRVLERRSLAPQRRVSLLFGAALRRRVRGGGRLGGDARTTLVEIDDRRRRQRAQLQPAATHSEVAQ